MSTGGINSQAVPLTGNQPVYAPTAQQPSAAPVVATPAAGVNAGTVAPSGGVVEDTARSAALATGIAGQALASQQQLNATEQAVAGQQVVGTTGVQPAAAPKGPAAWNDQWAKAFSDLGAPAELLQQLTFTGAMGADAAQLQEMYDGLRAEIEPQMAKFAAEHPEDFKKLSASKQVPKSYLVQIASAVNAGQVPKEQLEQMVEQLGMTQGKMLMDMLVKPMVVYSLVPGWGALRLLAGPFTGGKDPVSGEKMGLDFFTVATALGGGITLFNYGKSAAQALQGANAVKQGGDALAMARNIGLVGPTENALTGWTKLKTIMPGTIANGQMSGISRLQHMDDALVHLEQAAKLNPSAAGAAMTVEELSFHVTKNMRDQFVTGSAMLWGEGPSKYTWMFQPHTRGTIIGRTKALASTESVQNMATVRADLRASGKWTTPFVGAKGVHFADDALKTELAAFAGVPKGASLTKEALNVVEEQIIASSSQTLQGANYLNKSTGLSKIWGLVRPGPAQDAEWAVGNVLKNKSGITAFDFGQAVATKNQSILKEASLLQKHGWAGVPKWGKGLFFAGAAGVGGYFMYFKPQKEAKAKAEEEAAKAAAEQGVQGQPGEQQLTPELQGALQNFVQLPPEQRVAALEQQITKVQALANQPNLTAEQQASVDAMSQEINLFIQYHQLAIEQAQGGATAATGGGQVAPTEGAQPVPTDGAQPAPISQPMPTNAGLGLPQATA